MDSHKAAYLVNVRVEVLKPLSELLVFVRIINQGIGSVEYDIHALSVRKPFEQGTQLRRGSF